MNVRWMKLVAAFLAVWCVVVTPAVADTDEEEDDRLGWFSQVRVKLMAKNYGLDESEAEKLYRILQEEKDKTKDMERELRGLYDKLGAAVDENAGDAALTGIMKEIADKNVEIAKREGDTMKAVRDVLGPEKSAKWVLSKRGMIDQFKGSVKKARETMGEEEKKAPEKKGYGASRQGNAGYF